MTEYTETLDRLAERTKGALLAMYDQWQAGELSDDAFYALARNQLALADHGAASLADAALAAYITAAVGVPTPALGIEPDPIDYMPILAGALAYEYDQRGHLGRAGRAFALAAAQSAYGRAMRARGVPEWTRRLNGGACEYCTDLAGPNLPASVDMLTHDGCGCTQQPILN